MRIEIGSSNNHLLKDGAWLWLLRQFLGICLYACESIYSLNEKNRMHSYHFVAVPNSIEMVCSFYLLRSSLQRGVIHFWALPLSLNISKKLKKILYYLIKFDEVIVSAFFFPQKTLERKMGSNA